MPNKPDQKEQLLGRSVEWSRAHPDDAAEMAQVYNVWVKHGARVPAIAPTTEQQVRAMLADLLGRGYPVCCFWHQDRIIGWCLMEPLNWGGSSTLGTVSFSIYMTPDWVGLGVGAQAAFLTYRQIYALGFSSLTCWVLRGNRLSSNMARGLRLQLWGTLPQVAEAAGEQYDVEIWGCRLHDAEWRSHMDRLGAKLQRRLGGWVQERRRVVAPGAIAT